MTKVETMAVIPRSKVILTMLLPIILPSTMSPLPSKAAMILTTASGALVPKATIVRPTTIGDTFSFSAIEEAPSTKKSAPLINNKNPITSKIHSICVLLLSYSWLYDKLVLKFK